MYHLPAGSLVSDIKILCKIKDLVILHHPDVLRYLITPSSLDMYVVHRMTLLVSLETQHTIDYIKSILYKHCVIIIKNL